MGVLTAALLTLLVSGSGSRGPVPVAAQAGAATLSGLPLDFVENRGQWPEQARFVARNGSVAASFERDAIRLHPRLALQFEGASPGSTLVGERLRSGRYNFVFGKDPARWRANVRAYGSVLYGGLYDGVDVRVREAGGRLEYDVLVARRADLRQVIIRTVGATGVRIARDGALLLRMPGRTLRQAPPMAWQVLPDDGRRRVESRFRLLGPGRFGFEVVGRDPSLPLVVDPGLDWATYVGGNGDESLEELVLAPDGSGDVVVAGQTASPDFAHTSGNLVPVGWTPYVARLNAAGTGLVYATFFGGSAVHSVADVAVNASGEPVVVGDTNSVDFPTTPGAYDRSPGNGNGDYDAYVIKFNASGGLLFGTYLAGSPGAGSELARVAGFDPAGSVIVSGDASSSDFPRTAGAYPGQPGLFVSRLAATGSQLTYSAFLGPASAFDMVVDAQGFVTLTGQTASALFPTTADAFDRTLEGQRDAFVSRLKLDGGGAADLKYSTLLGGAQHIEAGNGIAVDPTTPELVTVSGFTRSGDFPTTAGALLRTHFVPIETTMGYVTRFRFPAGAPASLVWSTFYGAPGNQSADDVAVDGAGNAIVVGSTVVNNPPTTDRAYDRVPGSGFGVGFHASKGDGYIARISADGSRLLYSTLLGASGGDVTLEIAHAVGASVVVGGLTESLDFPVSAGAFDRVYAADGKPSGGSAPGTTAGDTFVARLTLEPPPPGDTTPPPAPELRGPADGATFTTNNLGVAFDWTDVADPSGIVAHHMQLSPNATFTNDFDAELAGWFEPWVPTSVAVKGLSSTATGTWYWRIQSLDRAGNLGPWSAVRTVNVVAPAPPPAPALTNPPNGGTFAPGNVTFAWRTATGATRYQLKLDTRSDFTSGSKVTVSGLTGTQHTRSIIEERRYWWRVRASNDFGTGPWSTVWSFELKKGAAPAPAPPPGSSFTSTTAGTAALAAVTVSDFVVGGNSAQGTVTLTAAAPAGGAVVSLASSYPAQASVPPSVTVPEGATQTTFTLTTVPSLILHQTFITGEYGGVTQGSLVSVYPELAIELATFTVSANSFLGGNTIQATVALIPSWTAPAGGVIVTLGSTNPALASVPASVTIPAGANSVGFTITTQPVTTTTNVTILASRSMTLRQTLELQPPGALTSLTVNPKTVTGGETSQGTVTLSSAVARDVVVALSSHDTTVATLPPSVTVPAGTTSATFTITTKPVSGNAGTWSQITASAGGITLFETINVNPGPATPPPGTDSVSVTRAEYDSGKRQLRVDATSTSSSATLKVYVTSSDALIGTLSNLGGGKYGGQFTWTVNPQSITVRSSLGGSATQTVAAR